MFKISKTNNQKGALNLLLLAAAVGILGLVGIISFLPLKDSLFGSLYQKQSSFASGAVDLTMSPESVTVENGKTFLVDVVIDAKTEQPTAISLVIKYNPSVLQLTAIERGIFFTEELVPSTIDNTAGTVTATYAQKPNQYKTGQGPVATLAFKAVGAGLSNIEFDSALTQISALGKTGNVAGLLTNSSATVTSGPNIAKTAEFSLSPSSGDISVSEFPVQVMIKNSTDNANLFSARLKYDPSKLEVTRIETNGAFITQWVSGTDSFNNTTGTASVIGGIQNPGYKTGSSPEAMATVYFKGKSVGATTVSFDGTSAVYRNSDNKNILIGGAAGNYTVSAVVTPTPTPTPTTSGTPTPTPFPSHSSTPTPSPSSSPTASASVPAVDCTISSASWIASTNPINEGRIVNLKAVGTGDCAGKTVTFNVFEDDGLLGSDPVRGKATSPVKFGSSNEALSSWLTEFQSDGFSGLGNPPEYIFTAGITGSSISVKSSAPHLAVNPVSGDHPTGDLNSDLVIDLADLSVLLTNWDVESGIDDYDTNEDGKINTFDFSFIIYILKIEGVIQ